MNRKTKALTEEQYKELIQTIRSGFLGTRPNEKVATALVIEANLGLRIGDVLRLKLSDIVPDGDRYRLDITEQKTGKQRTFTVPYQIYMYLENYCLRNGIDQNARIFPFTERLVQIILCRAAEYLGYQDISTHSFRKFFATSIYLNNDYDIVLVQQLLQHSSTAITQKYIGVEPKRIQDALEKQIKLI